MTRRRVLVTFAALLVAGVSCCLSPALAQTPADPLQEIGRRLDNPALLRGDFEQTKTLKGFKRPLVAHGTFVMVRELGVQWVTTDPFASTLVVTRERLLTLGEGAPRQMDTRQQPGLRAVNDVLMAVLSGDIKVLAERFQCEATLIGDHGWRLNLVPRDAALARFMTRIELEGERHVNQVRLLEASGDDSRIRFFRQSNTALSPAEAERFN